MVRRGQQFVSDNAPVILTATAIAGTVVTTVFAAKAGYQAGYEVALDEATGGVKDDESKKDRQIRIAKKTWKLYLPSAVSGVGTIAAIATANKINTSRTAALAAAYTITDKAFTEYKDKVKETVGDKKETEIQDKIAQDRVNATSQSAGLVVIGDNDVLCYDMYSDRYFPSSMEKIKKAVNDTNHEIINSFYVSLTEFYTRVGLPATGFSDDIGWNSDNLMDVHFSSVMTPDDRPALAFRFHVDPIRGFSKTHG